MTDPSNNPAPANYVELSRWWHKPLIWTVFIVLLYLLREFFLIGFLTFLICFMVRGFVGFLMRRIGPKDDSRIVELILTLSIFVAVCLAMYSMGRICVPPLVHEGKSLVVQLQNMGAGGMQNSLLSNTVGKWQFQRQYGSSTDPRYQDEFKKFKEAGRSGEGLYQSFPELTSRLQAGFEAKYEQAQVQHLKTGVAQGSLASDQFEQWLEKIRAPNVFAEKSDFYISRWEASLIAQGKVDDLESLKKEPDFESVRQQQIQRQILEDLESDPVLLTELKNQWTKAQSTQRWSKFRKSSDYQKSFQAFYEERRKENPVAVPLDFSFYESLANAYPVGEKDFLRLVRQHYESDRETVADQQLDFESATKLQLGQQWWGSSPTADWIREHARTDGPAALESLGAWLEARFTEILRIPIQVATSMIIAVFLLVEWQRMKTDVINIRKTRLKPIFDEIAPGVIALGKLIGKTFQGQAVIAIFNAGLTFAGLWLIGVEYRFVLALFTFVFSFIPVVGVILSGVPMFAIAIFQPGGSLLLAMQVVMIIAVIHLIEGMILAPRIIGKIGHLSPVLVIAILLIAEHFFGMWGLILGVPVAIYLIRVVLLNSEIPGVYDPQVSYFNDDELVAGSESS